MRIRLCGFLLLLLFVAAQFGASCGGLLTDDRELSVTAVHTGSLNAIAFSPDGELIVTAANDGVLWIMDVSKLYQPFSCPSCVNILPTPVGDSPLHLDVDDIWSLAFLPGSRKLLIGVTNGWQGGQLIQLDVDSGKMDIVVKDVGNGVDKIAVAPSGLWVALADVNSPGAGEIQLIKRDGWDVVWSDWLVFDQVVGMGFSANETELIVGLYDGLLVRYATADGSAELLEGIDLDRISALALSADGQKLIAAGPGGQSGVASELVVWNLAGQSEEIRVGLDAANMKQMVIAPAGRMVALGSGANDLLLVDSATGEVAYSFKGHLGAVRAVAFPPSGALLASGGDGWELRLWYVYDLTGQVCGDGIDNDLDGWTDAADPDCAVDEHEWGFADFECNDGRDNDDDGLTDSADPDCKTAGGLERNDNSAD